MKIRKPLMIACALFFGVVAPAAALVPIPDACAWGVCVTFTHTTALAQIQSLLNQAIMLSNESRNLSTIGKIARTPIGQDIGSMIGSSNTQNPLSIGDIAAQQAASQAQNSANTVARTDAVAESADGAQQQTQVSNLYLSTIAGESVKANALAASEQVQHQNQTTAELSGMQEFFSGQQPNNEQL